MARWTVVESGKASRIEPSREKPLLEWKGNEAEQHVGGALLAHPTERLLYVTTSENNQNANLHPYCDNLNTRLR